MVDLTPGEKYMFYYWNGVNTLGGTVAGGIFGAALGAGASYLTSWIVKNSYLEGIRPLSEGEEKNLGLKLKGQLKRCYTGNSSFGLKRRDIYDSLR